MKQRQERPQTTSRHLPLWADHKLEGATRTQTGAVLWVVVIIAVIPWRHVFTQYVTAPIDPWRRCRRS